MSRCCNGNRDPSTAANSLLVPALGTSEPSGVGRLGTGPAHRLAAGARIQSSHAPWIKRCGIGNPTAPRLWSGALASKEGALQGQSAIRRCRLGRQAGSKPPFGRVPGGLAAWLGAACRGHDYSGSRTWHVSCSIRQRETATTALPGRRRTRVTVAPGHPSPVPHRPAGRPRQVVLDPGPLSRLIPLIPWLIP
jgi:hypothetical protein